MPINFSLAQGGYGTPLPGSDYISGYLIYAASAPSGMALSVPQACFSINDAIALGITNTYSDETQATAAATFTTHAAPGDVITVNIPEPTINAGPSNVVTLTSYTVLTSDTTATILATSVAASINSQTYLTGYTATSSGAVLTIKARLGLGVSINTIATQITDSNPASPGLITNGTFSGGIASKLAVYYYQISEFFRMQPSGKLWVGFYAIPSSYTFTELNSIQIYANGEIRQFMVYSDHGTSYANILADLGAINAVGTTMFNEITSGNVFYASNISALSLSLMPNLRTLTYPWVSMCIGPDGGAQGALLSLITGKSVPALGACLGTVALSRVQQDIACVGLFNITNGTEDETIAFATGQLAYQVSTGLQSQLNSYGYIFLEKQPGVSGSFWNDSHVANLITSDYSYIERGRTIGKVQRVAYASIAPLLNSNLIVDGNGNLLATTISVFTDAIRPNLSQMVSKGEISAYTVYINPNQQVLVTSTLDIVIGIVGVGVARIINISLGFQL